MSISSTSLMRHRSSIAAKSAIVALVGLVFCTVAAVAQDLNRAKEIATTQCVACHAADGNSIAASFPKLAGQHAGYLKKQLKEYKAVGTAAPVRVDAIMNAQVLALTDAEMNDLAVYFSQQKLNPEVATDKSGEAMAAKLYRSGDANRQIAACAGCHGPAGLGVDKQYPHLSGQYAEYTKAQLNAFRAGTRTNDPAGMMRSVSALLSDKEIAALADYIAGLRAAAQ